MPSSSLLGGLRKHLHLPTDFLISHPFSLFLMHLVRTILNTARTTTIAMTIPTIGPDLLFDVATVNSSSYSSFSIGKAGMGGGDLTFGGK